MRHRAVFFDLGGTLFSYASINAHFDRLLTELARGRGVETPVEKLRHAYRIAMGTTMSGWAGRPYYLHRDLFTEAHVQFLRSLGVEASADDPDLRFSQGRVLGEPEIAPRADAATTLAALRARGLHVSIVSNIDDDQLEAVWSRLGLDAHVDAITTSEEARSCKPDARIFELALAKAGDPPPASVVFVGDSPWHDVAGANALGMTSVLLGAAPAGAPIPHHQIDALAELLAIVGA
ncbi:HAD family hydrolase [Myxococcota bacterium]|nr:HAD family hydrolase [Myxococcota bacterium]MCZ7617806.1 HAD family hydrolase [Myxococcota bacterium]